VDSQIEICLAQIQVRETNKKRQLNRQKENGGL
jgi:hypothetical protein